MLRIFDLSGFTRTETSVGNLVHQSNSKLISGPYFKNATSNFFVPLPWQADLLCYVKSSVTKEDKRQVLWVNDPSGNSGKSFLAQYLEATKLSVTIRADTIDGMRAFFCGSDRRPIYIVDIARATNDSASRAACQLVEEFKDNNVQTNKYRGKQVVADIILVGIVFSNHPIPADALSEDRPLCLTIRAFSPDPSVMFGTLEDSVRALPRQPVVNRLCLLDGLDVVFPLERNYANISADIEYSAFLSRMKTMGALYRRGRPPGVIVNPEHVKELETLIDDVADPHHFMKLCSTLGQPFELACKKLWNQQHGLLPSVESRDDSMRHYLKLIKRSRQFKTVQDIFETIEGNQSRITGFLPR